MSAPTTVEESVRRRGYWLFYVVAECPECGKRTVSHERRYDLPRPERYDDRHKVVVDSSCAERDISGL